MTVGMLISQARNAKGWSLDRLATEMGVTKQLVWQWERWRGKKERGTSDPTTHLERLREVLGLQRDYFWGDAPESPLQAKIRSLTADEAAFAEKMVDAILSQRPALSKKRRKLLRSA